MSCHKVGMLIDTQLGLDSFVMCMPHSSDYAESWVFSEITEIDKTTDQGEFKTSNNLTYCLSILYTVTPIEASHFHH